MIRLAVVALRGVSQRSGGCEVLRIEWLVSESFVSIQPTETMILGSLIEKHVTTAEYYALLLTQRRQPVT